MNGGFLDKLNATTRADYPNYQVNALQNLAHPYDQQEALRSCREYRHPVTAEQLVRLTTAIVEALPYDDWCAMSAFVSTILKNSTMSPHRDDERDVRIIVEGNEALWTTDDSDMPLYQGDVVVINNLCDKNERFRHGVRIDTYRKSYGFSFTPNDSLPD
jgi:hypothetical protein